MAINDVLGMNLSGKYCGVPIAISLAYRQELDDPVGETTGRQLVTQWFTEADGPWDRLRDLISDDLNWECAVVNYGDESETVLITGGEGLAALPSWPTPYALQVNIPSSDSWPDSREGRFFMPGFTLAEFPNGVMGNAVQADLALVMNALLNVDDTGGGIRYVLYPHADYKDRNGGVSAKASVPYPSPFIKNIGNRRADNCAAFQAAGGGSFSPIVVPPPV